jgi:hypothetical protein
LAIFLLSGVSNIVTAGSNVDLETEDIYQLCYICCEALKLEISTANKYKFLCSLYHITKFLLRKVTTGYLQYTVPPFILKRIAISCIIEVMFTI